MAAATVGADDVNSGCGRLRSECIDEIVAMRADYVVATCPSRSTTREFRDDVVRLSEKISAVWCHNFADNCVLLTYGFKFPESEFLAMTITFVSRTKRHCARFVAAAVRIAIASLVLMSPVAMAAGTIEVSEFARSQLNMLVQEKEARTATQQKIDSQILLTIDALSAAPRYSILHSLDRPLPNAKGLLEVDIDLFRGGDMMIVVQAIADAGGKVGFASEGAATIRAWLPTSGIEAVAAIKQVRFVGRKGGFRTNKLTTSEGDKTHKADRVRSQLGYTGVGQKICVLSDGIDSLVALQASGDLPANIYVLPGQTGSGDEGSAMLEIIYDLAPGAQLGFATANNGQASFAQNIRDLADPAKGACTIIVDDVGYFKESPFQDNDVAESVNVVTAAGIAYFSAAGNEGNISEGTGGTWEGDFVPAAVANSLIPGHDVHLWAAGVTTNIVTAGQNPLVLHWSDPFGSSTTDYDLYVLNSAGSAVLRSSTNNQTGTQDPFEIISPATGNAASVNEQIIVARKTGEPIRMFNMQLSRGRLTYATTGSTRGHNSAANGFGVAATPAAVSIGAPTPNGPFPGEFVASDRIERFSSDGPRRIFYAFNGSLLPGAPAGNFGASGGVVRNKPDITAADGVSTSAPGFSAFYGTSAAAPHAAAIAGLIKQAFPSMTITQLRAALTTVPSPLDIMTAGPDIGSGAGIIRPLETLQALGAPAIPAISLGTVSKTQIAGNGDANVDPNEDWKLDIALNNTSATSANALSATLTSNTPGVVVTSGAVAYGTLAGGGSASNPAGSPFRFSVLNVNCGVTLQFTLTVTYTGAMQPASFILSVPTTGTLAAAQTFTYAGGVVAIPDNNATGATAPLNVASGPANVGKVNVRIGGTACTTAAGSTTVGIDHTFVGDLAIDLVSPSGTTVKLWSNRGANGQNLCQTVFDDQAAAAISGVINTNAPFTGSFRPESPLSAFNGVGASGNWALKVVDSGPADTGSIRAFSLAISPLTCAAVSNSVAMTATKTVAGSFVVGGTVTYTVVISNTGSGVQADNAGDEYVDVLPTQLALASATATRGTASMSGNTVRWNGALEAGASVTLTINATINAGTAGQTVSSQGTVNFDADHNGSNEASRLTDDPGVAGPTNPTTFVVQSGPQPVSITFAGSGTGSTTSATAGLTCSANCSTTVNGGISVVVNATPTGGSVFTGWLGPCTGTGSCTFVAGSANAVTATFAPGGTVPTLDVDASSTLTKYDAATDGVMALRALFGVSGDAISAGVRGGTASRDAAAIAAYFGNVMPKLDINGDGKVQALTDGLLIVRYLLTLRGSALVAGIPLTALRPTAADIESYLASLVP